ncbi:hypothetical protein HYFRA_00006696 [Hymenoscyphus fraxineus]|uniref:Shugoshin n=1 Tax=Hymenoscyphus fraxineus TaxID=746836 RepID=A0A9N9KTV1_9HELO|nr:hypothetical protein HYFRA_00006696 [Hymenoscyphus fraxineus]
MARLNEVPASTENVESLKRKFMRQNRDIARANSAQSLRIRSLENEVSKLLADNLGLRGHIINLQNEIENGQAQRIAEHTGHIKAELEAKLAEIGAMLNGLGQVQPTKKSPRAGKTTRKSLNSSPDQKNWKNMCNLSEAVASQEGRLPPILENKQYPRKTLEHQELLQLVADAEDTTESPDIGPPPVSKFVDEDPVKIDLPSRRQSDDTEEPSDIDPVLSKNLEQRRKRRSSGTPNDTNVTTVAMPPQDDQERKEGVKTGAKRKLNVREDEEKNDASRNRPISADDFKFSRVSEEKSRSRVVVLPERSTGKSAREIAIARGARDKRSSTTSSTGRRALAAKNINTSPKKSSRATNQDDIKVAKAEMPKLNLPIENLKDSKRATVTIQPVEEPQIVNTVEVLLEPETPAALDTFSPFSAGPSTARLADSRDTPPPPDLGPGAEGSRPSRRARGAVSYAEPNLRDKMRRPTKEMIDAVARDGNAARGSAVKLENNPSLSDNIKSEPEEDCWKNMPLASAATVANSPLRSKATEQDLLPSSITTHRKRRESLLQQAPLEKTGSEAAMTSLLAEHRKAKAAREKALENEGAGLANAVEKLEIYEFSGSASPDIPQLKPAVEEKSVFSRSTRRQSSATRENTNVDDGEASDMEIKKRPLVSRRRQSTLGVRAESSNDKNSALRKALNAQNAADTSVADSRGDRISARRRSMML